MLNTHYDFLISAIGGLIGGIGFLVWKWDLENAKIKTSTIIRVLFFAILLALIIPFVFETINAKLLGEWAIINKDNETIARVLQSVIAGLGSEQFVKMFFNKLNDNISDEDISDEDISDEDTSDDLT